MPRFSTSISIDGQRVECTIPRGTPAWRKANSIFCPLGPAPTRAWFVMQKGELDGLSTNGAHTVTWIQATSVDDPDTGASTTNYKPLTFPGLYLLKAERLLLGGPDDGSALYLVELTDGRYIASKNSDCGVVNVNIRGYATVSDYLAGTTANGTWEAMVAALWAACPSLGAFPGLPATLPGITVPPQNTWLIGLNGYRALNAVLDQLDCAIDPQAFSATFGIVQLGESQSIPAEADTLRWDGQPKSISVTQAAASLTIYHYDHYGAYGQENDTELANNWAVNASGRPTPITTGISGASGTKALWDDLPIVLDHLGQPINMDVVNQRNLHRLERYVQRYSVLNTHRIHYGLLDSLAPGGEIRATLWRNYDDDDEQTDVCGTLTEFICCPQLITSIDASGSDGISTTWIDSQIMAPEREPYGPPDVSRHSFPTYPRLPNIVEVAHGQNSNLPANHGDLVGPDYTNELGWKLHSGRVRRWVNETLVILERCLIFFVDDVASQEGDVSAIEGECYGPGRLSGISKVDGFQNDLQLPVYTVRRGTPEQFVEMVTLHPANGTGALQLGAIGLGGFLGYTITSKFGTSGAMEQDRLCIIQFADFGINEEAAGLAIVAEYGRIYGPAKYVGDYDAGDLGVGPIPVYRCSVGRQEFRCKSDSGYTKGSVGTFQLYDINNNPLPILLDAICRYNAYVATKFARMDTTIEGREANQIEC